MKKVSKVRTPCDKCPKQEECITHMCIEWKLWFKNYWRRLRHKYGMDKVVKNDGE